MSKSRTLGLDLVIAKILFLVSSVLLSACNAQQVEMSSEKNRAEEYSSLGLVGYNYTDRDIDSYSINGAGGGSIILSSPTSGGSGVTCCVKLSKIYSGPSRVKVKWQVGGCKYLIKDERTGEADSIRHFYYKEVEADVHHVAGENPKFIEAHFYPDGTVQVQLVEHSSPPRLLLNGDRSEKSFFPRCKDDKKPDK